MFNSVVRVIDANACARIAGKQTAAAGQRAGGVGTNGFRRAAEAAEAGISATIGIGGAAGEVAHADAALAELTRGAADIAADRCCGATAPVRAHVALSAAARRPVLERADQL